MTSIIYILGWILNVQALFMLLPLFTVRNLRRAMQEYVYIP